MLWIFQWSMDCCKPQKLISSLSLDPREIEEVIAVGEGLEEGEKWVKKDIVRCVQKKLGNKQ